MRKELALMRIKAGSGDFPGGPVVRNLLASAGDRGPIPALGRSHVLQGNSSSFNYISKNSLIFVSSYINLIHYFPCEKQ